MDRRAEEDRRKVDRFSHPQIQVHFRQTQFCLRFLVILTAIGAVFSVVKGLATGQSQDFAFGVFLATLLTCVLVLLHRYHIGIRDYLTNESVGNLDKVIERQFQFWMVFSFLAAIGACGVLIYHLF